MRELATIASCRVLFAASTSSADAKDLSPLMFDGVKMTGVGELAAIMTSNQGQIATLEINGDVTNMQFPVVAWKGKKLAALLGIALR